MTSLHDSERTGRGTSAHYLIQRALRDCPEKVEALFRGEYPSAFAMGVSAGFITKRRQVSWTHTEGLAKSLRRQLSADEMGRLVELLKGP
jgi:hypothetical protein